VEAHGVDVLVVQPPMGKDVALRTRTDIANAWGADLYWSIHANAGDRSTKGIAGFYWSISKEGKKIADIFPSSLRKLECTYTAAEPMQL
jgi:N-acetylmuramoyl-L-alanine amidase